MGGLVNENTLLACDINSTYMPLIATKFHHKADLDTS